MPLHQLMDALADDTDSSEALFASAFPHLAIPWTRTFSDGLPSGWVALALRLLAGLDALAANGGALLEAPPMKEKLGRLRVGLDTDGFEDPLRRTLGNLIRAAEHESAQRCVRCGRRGIITRTGGWISPRCVLHDAPKWPRRSSASAHLRMRVASAIGPRGAWRRIETPVDEAFDRCAVGVGSHKAVLDLGIIDGQPDVAVHILGRLDGAPTVAPSDSFFADEEVLATKALAALRVLSPLR